MRTKKYKTKIFDPKESKADYKKSKRGIMIPGEDDTFINYRKRKTIQLVLVEMTWKQVFLFSMYYAFAIFGFKIVWFELFGKPQFFAKHSVLEKELQAELAKTQPPTSSRHPKHQSSSRSLVTGR